MLLLTGEVLASGLSPALLHRLLRRDLLLGLGVLCRLLHMLLRILGGLLLTILRLLPVRKILTGVEGETESVAGTSFRQAPLDGLVDIRAADTLQRDGLEPLVHHRQILDVLKPLDRDAGLHPGGPPIGEVVPSFRVLVDGVRGVGEVRLHDPPCPCPGDVGQVALPLRVLTAVNCIQRLEDAAHLVVCFHKRLNLKDYRRGLFPT